MRPGAARASIAWESALKNRRNTRRGRAKRWELWICDGHAAVWMLRVKGMPRVWVGNTFSREWIVRAGPRPWGTLISYKPNRAAAMREAEHIARLR